MFSKLKREATLLSTIFAGTIMGAIGGRMVDGHHAHVDLHPAPTTLFTTDWLMGATLIVAGCLLMMWGALRNGRQH